MSEDGLENALGILRTALGARGRVDLAALPEDCLSDGPEKALDMLTLALLVAVPVGRRDPPPPLLELVLWGREKALGVVVSARLDCVLREELWEARVAPPVVKRKVDTRGSKPARAGVETSGATECKRRVLLLRLSLLPLRLAGDVIRGFRVGSVCGARAERSAVTPRDVPSPSLECRVLGAVGVLEEVERLFERVEVALADLKHTNVTKFWIDCKLQVLKISKNLWPRYKPFDLFRGS